MIGARFLFGKLFTEGKNEKSTHVIEKPTKIYYIIIIIKL